MFDAGVDSGSTECGTPMECAYRPQVTARLGREGTHMVGYDDAAGLERMIQIQVRFPSGLTDPLPIVVWSHGGAQGIGTADGAGREWSDQIVRAGYAFVAIAHRARTVSEYTALCTAVGF